MVAQKDAIPSHAAIILSLEAVFAAIAGWLFLDESLTLKSYLGAAIMLAGMLLAQLWPHHKPQQAIAGTADAR
ncbi:EamA-like transporter family protein [compost metagenome]